MFGFTAALTSHRPDEIAGSPDLDAIGQRLNQSLDLLRRDAVWLPEHKPLLSRQGGVCPDDGARLLFDPVARHDHRCPKCHQVVRGELHDRAWSWRYHLWLSERAIHAAVLWRTGHAEDGRELASKILDAYVDRYSTYPNQDNVLGPSRLFFSTYLESIWLTQMVLAADLLGTEEGYAHGDRLEAIVRESAALIEAFDEGWSNRQVWNNTALTAAGLFLDDHRVLQHALGGTHGVQRAMRTVVTDDGWWHEGENYHFFALHGFLMAAELLRGTPHDLWESDAGVLGKMFVAPLDTLLPDLTFPARGDSPHGVSVRQPRFAEMWEIGRARHDDPRISRILTAIYALPDSPPDNTGREIAEVETHRPGGPVRRSGLGWKTLACARPDAPVDDGRWIGPSVVVRGVGPAVLRPDSERCLLLETGSGAGHGHPDALHLSLFDGAPWLTDFGTGSYVSESLFWYRSTGAHNAPGVPVRGQAPSRGYCSVLAEQDGWSVAAAVVPELLGPDSMVERRVVVGPRYVVDVVFVHAPATTPTELPVHLQGWQAAGPDDQRLHAALGEHCLDVHLFADVDEQREVKKAPGPPSLFFADGAPEPFLLRRISGTGQLGGVFAAPGVVTSASVVNNGVCITGDGFEEHVQWTDAGARIVLGDETINLSGALPVPALPAVPPPPQVPHVWAPMISQRLNASNCFDHVPWNAIHPLHESNYRRSEEPYPGQPLFSARVATWVSGSHLLFAAEVRKPDIVTLAKESVDLDNETHLIHADGVQCYWSGPGSPARWQGVVATLDDDGVQTQPVGSQPSEPSVVGSVHAFDGGYRVMVSVETGRPVKPGDRYRFNIVVNEARPGRQRRAGQLAFVGGGGWVYLRGDREPMETAAVAEVR